MALRKPLVLNGGRTQQLQPGDTLDATVVVANTSSQLTNANASPITIGQVVYSVTADNVDLAKADAASTSDAIGLVGDASIANAAAGTIVTGGVLSGLTGLTSGSIYYLSAATAGAMTTTAPSTVGESVVELGIALSTTKFLVRIRTAILL